MHSFLIVSKNKKTALEYAFEECKKSQIDKFDSDILTFEKPIGIEDVRNLQKKIILKPIKSKTKAVILDGSNGLTMEAQNALLKILEEPPANTIVYITTTNKDLMLPTIISRCKVIELKDKHPELSKEENTQYLNILISLSSSSIGEKLKLAQDISKKKEDTIPWLEKMIMVARENLIDTICHPERSRVRRGEVEGSPEAFYDASWDSSSRQVGTQNDSITYYLNLLISLNKTHTVLKTTNVNQRLALENLFLNL